MKRLYKAVLFDLGYTLVRTNREDSLQRRLRHMGIQVALEELERAYHAVDKHFMREFPGRLGKDPQDYQDEYTRMLLQKLGLAHSVELSAPSGDDKFPRGAWSLIPGVDAALQALRDAGIQTGLISNWDLSARDVLARCGILHLFDAIVISSEIGMEKPNPGIFQEALANLAVAPEEALYVGDNYYDDIIGAQSVGMDGVLINRFGQFGIEEIGDCPVFLSVVDVVDAISPAGSPLPRGAISPLPVIRGSEPA